MGRTAGNIFITCKWLSRCSKTTLRWLKPWDSSKHDEHSQPHQQKPRLSTANFWESRSWMHYIDLRRCVCSSSCPWWAGMVVISLLGARPYTGNETANSCKTCVQWWAGLIRGCKFVPRPEWDCEGSRRFLKYPENFPLLRLLGIITGGQ